MLNHTIIVYYVVTVKLGDGNLFNLKPDFQVREVKVKKPDVTFSSHKKNSYTNVQVSSRRKDDLTFI